MAGVDHVGIGGDYDGVDALPVGLGGVDAYPALLAELMRRGWSEADIRKLAGENVLRVMRAAEAVACEQADERPGLAAAESILLPRSGGSVASSAQRSSDDGGSLRVR